MRERRELEQRDLEVAMVPDRFWDASLRDSTLQEPNIGRLRRFAERVVDVADRGLGVYLWGANGCGKSAAAVALLKEALRYGYSGLWVSAPDVVQSRFQPIEVDHLFKVPFERRMREVQFLVIDDLGKEHRDDKGFAIRVIEQLVRDRSAGRLNLIVTSNVEYENVAKLYKPTMLEVMKAATVGLRCEGPDRRMDEMRAAVEFFK